MAASLFGITGATFQTDQAEPDCRAHRPASSNMLQLSHMRGRPNQHLGDMPSSSEMSLKFICNGHRPNIPQSPVPAQGPRQPTIVTVYLTLSLQVVSNKCDVATHAISNKITPPPRFL